VEWLDSFDVASQMFLLEQLDSNEAVSDETELLNKNKD
jgi:hypothetical protein